MRDEGEEVRKVNKTRERGNGETRRERRGEMKG